MIKLKIGCKVVNCDHQKLCEADFKFNILKHHQKLCTAVILKFNFEISKHRQNCLADALCEVQLWLATARHNYCNKAEDPLGMRGRQRNVETV